VNIETGACASASPAGRTLPDVEPP
jgi:hypothetical protein